MPIFKVKLRTDELYRKVHGYSPKGKTWNSIGALKLHLRRRPLDLEREIVMGFELSPIELNQGMFTEFTAEAIRQQRTDQRVRELARTNVLREADEAASRARRGVLRRYGMT